MCSQNCKRKMLLYFFFSLRLSSVLHKIGCSCDYSTPLFSIEVDFIRNAYWWLISSIGRISTQTIKPPVVVCKLHMSRYGHHCLFYDLT